MNARQAEIERVLTLFSEGETRVTLSGAVGVGKTWIARAVAERWRARGDDVVWITAARSEPELDDALAAALGGSGDVALTERSLVVLDGATRTDALRQWLTKLEDACVLSTSRERLEVDREHVVQVATIAPEPARALFVEHARRRGYAISPADDATVFEIVRLLDGLPLAIELAAARIAIMTPRDLCARLRAGLEVLGALGSALEGALDELAPAERDALAQLTVFRGGFLLESAEAVVDVSAHHAITVDILTSLRDKSIVSRDGDRLTVLGVLGERAVLSADPRSLAAAEDRHAEHFGELCDRLARGDRRRLLAERENVLALAERMLSKTPVTARRAEPVLRAMSALGDALLDASGLAAFEALLEPTLVATRGSGAKPALEAAMVLTRGALRLRRGDVPSATRDLLSALGVATTLRDPLLEARATLELGHALTLRGDAKSALEHFERAAAMFEGAGFTVDYGRALHAAGASLMHVGRTQEALATLDRAVAACADSPEDADAARLMLARVRLDAGDARSAAALIDEVRAAQRSRRLLARASWAAGLLALDRSQVDAAEVALRLASTELRALGVVRDALRVELALSLARRDLGHDGEAYVLAKGALAGLRDADADGAAMACAHVAVLEVEAGRTDLARTLLGSVPRALSAEANDVLGAAHLRLDASWPAPAAVTAHGRVARRVWQSVSPSKRPPPPDDALLVGANASWCRPPGGERIALDRRRNMALVLAHLVAQHAIRPGAAVSSSELIAAGWPGEKVIATAGAHRVRVAIATLRKLGLKDAIVTTPDGYALAANLAIVRVD